MAKLTETKTTTNLLNLAFPAIVDGEHLIVDAIDACESMCDGTLEVIINRNSGKYELQSNRQNGRKLLAESDATQSDIDADDTADADLSALCEDAWSRAHVWVGERYCQSSIYCSIDTIGSAFDALDGCIRAGDAEGAADFGSMLVKLLSEVK